MLISIAAFVGGICVGAHFNTMIDDMIDLFFDTESK
jgi:hypothetical protein